MSTEVTRPAKRRQAQDQRIIDIKQEVEDLVDATAPPLQQVTLLKEILKEIKLIREAL